MTDSTDTADSTDLEPAIRPVTDEQTAQSAPSQETNDAPATSTPTAANSDAASTDVDTSDEPEHPADTVPDGMPQTFEAAIEAGRLKQLLTLVTAIVDECRFHLGEDALYIRGVDPANVAMTDLAISPDMFETYASSGGTIGVDLERLGEVLTLANQNDLVQFDLDPTTRKLGITIDTVEITVALLDPQTIRHEPDLPTLDLPATVTILADDLGRAITAGDMVSDHLLVGVDPTSGCVRAEASGDTDDVTLEIDRADCAVFDTAMEPVESLYSLEYLNQLCKPLPSDAPITLELGDEFPLDITFSAVEDTIDGRCLLAPRLDAD
jgi:proliferating cell nuclear antigen